MTIKMSAPGKLYIAGEYAVVQPQHLALITPTPQRIHVEITPSTQSGSIHSPLFTQMPVKWYRRQGQLVLDQRENPYHLIVAALQVVEELVHELDLDARYYHLNVTSELNRQDGVKYGLGSSGAVTVATVKAALAFYGLDYFMDQPLNIFKLAAISHLRINHNGSAGDLATSTFEQSILYSSFDRDWVRNQLAHGASLLTLLEITWPSLEIRPFTIHPSIQMLVGWTGVPASTTDTLDELEDVQSNLMLTDEMFGAQSDRYVLDLKSALEHGNWSSIKENIAQLRQLLLQYTAQHHITLETPPLQELIQLSQAHQLAAKSSGAGGGDCGICFYPAQEAHRADELKQNWQDKQITPLAF
ncbi:phosphomevalonate kinase [Atopobacter phocae]|uniref:phosphomevalonate kinase n=1 Tax=Atopobacter phocae TaxID=136492 RepID=UPI00047113A6|nr:phosphomevalonate kinase [Atopobacter phocae]